MSLYDDDRRMVWGELAKDLVPLPKVKKPMQTESNFDCLDVKGHMGETFTVVGQGE